MCNLSLYRKARPWQRRAHELWEEGKSKPDNWDCDIRTNILRQEMREAGLKSTAELLDNEGTVRISGDYVFVRGKIGTRRHVRLVMKGNYIIDAGTDNTPAGFKMTWPRKIIWV